ncbi:tyrosine-type recombinase/integrase [Riemerella anatipestifer]|nr:tyrosine-type recombinase/integrase [Riemerella anatipestifer]
MINIKRKINIELEKRKKDGILIDENVPIFFRVTYNSNRINLFSGFRIDRKDWNENQSLVKNGKTNPNGLTAEEINTNLSNLINDIQTFFIKCQVENNIPDKLELKEYFAQCKDRGNKKKKTVIPTEEIPEKSFFEVYDHFTDYSGKVNNWTLDTHKKFNALKNHLLSFNKNLTFEDFNSEGLPKLLSYFSNTLKLNNVTTKKYLKNIKWFLRFAVKFGYCDNLYFQQFSPKIKTTDKVIIFLSEEEINAIRKYNIPTTKKYLERVRDILLFTCFTGLRHSDVEKLKKADVKNGKLYIITKKTSDSIVIELNDISKSILEKYENLDGDKALPVISNQKMNEYLKELGKLAGIDEPINHTYFIGNKRNDESKPKYEYFSSHIGRRTFICLCISKGIPIQVIMKWTGHSDYQSMKPYIDVVDTTREIQMQKLNIL